ncbi:MAG: pyridoxamine 5'-phosphate oxidase family protein [Aigarchaeota archaeon]|nr:pyridoxamine 5'-phosphate oxidase family protein [Candidatus Calditenuaceae archaeon]
MQTSKLPDYVEEVLEGALVAILTVIDEKGEPVSHPMLPLYDRESGLLYFTSSILFSKKLSHIKRNSKVSVLVSHRDYVKSNSFHAVQIKGEARVLDRNLSDEWQRLLPLWRRKEPYIERFIKQRFAIPLFWERAVIEVRPKLVTVWVDGDLEKEPSVLKLGEMA